MLEDGKVTNKKWRGVSRLIDNWLDKRQKLLILYCSLNGVDRLNIDDRPINEKMLDLCQLLVDYVSEGHFEIYERLQNAVLMEDNSETDIDDGSKLLNKIQITTDICLDFNDDFDKFSDIPSLQKAVSKLGEILEDRFSFEDKLIQRLYKYKDDSSKYVDEKHS